MKKERKKSIRLVILVTIVILLTLACVTIKMIEGENEIIKNAQEEKTNAEVAGIKEKSELKIAETSDMINELVIGHTLSFVSEQNVSGYTNKNIEFNINVSEIDYETEADIDTLTNSLNETIGEENTQIIIDKIYNGEITSLEGFPSLKKFKVIMKDAKSGELLKEVDLTSKINKNSIQTQLTVEQNCIIGIECTISSKIEFYDSDENINMEAGWDNIYTSEDFLTINQIDKILPTITISPNGATTSQSQNIIITAEDKGVSGLSSSNSYQYQLGTSNTEIPTGVWQDYTSGTEFTIGEGLTGNYYVWVKSISDNAGNKSSEKEYVVSNQYIFNNTVKDTTKPIINSVTGNATEWTNQNVTLKINAIDNESGIAGYSFDNGENWQTTNSKTYTENTNGIAIKVKDNEDNVATYSEIINIDKIDKIAPTITITPNGANTSKSKDVIINVADSGGSGLSSSNSYQYQLGTSNTEIPTGVWQDYTSGTEFTIGEELTGDYYIWVKRIADNAGNKAIESDYLVSNKFVFDNSEVADKIPPKLSVEYSTTELTNESVTAIITGNEQLQQLEGWTISEDGKTLTKIYTENTEENIDVYDLVGNKTTVQVKINNIDKNEIEAIVEYSTTILTNENVTVKIISSKEIKEIDGWTLLEDKNTLTKEYTENSSENVKLQDLLGNEREIKILVQNIDKIPPKVDVKYSILTQNNKSLTVTITANEELKELEGWNLEEDGKTLTKIYTKNIKEDIELYDLAGNKAIANITISNIDTSIPNTDEHDTTEETIKNIDNINKQEAEEKYKETSKEETKDQTIATSIMPNTGNKTLIGVVIIIIIVLIILWKKNKKYKDI